MCTLHPPTSNSSSLVNITAYEPIPDFNHLATLQRKFAEILEPSLSGGLALGVELSELSLRDLSAKVSHSELPGRKILVGHINAFAVEAKFTSTSLRALVSQMGGAIDKFVLHYSHSIGGLTSLRS